MSDTIIKLEDIDFYYDKGKPTELHALQNINLEIKQGEFVSFFGSSGCGKSTLLYVISGIDQPTDGHVWINGHDLVTFAPSDIAMFRQMGIGLIFQSFNLIPSLSIIDNVMLPMAFLGISEERRRTRAVELLSELDIAHLADRFPYELSGGQQQRVGIARALANDPPLILADEPTGNLDSANAVRTLELLKDLSRKKGKTVILVTHEAWSLKYVDRIFYMKDGMITKAEDVRTGASVEIDEEGKGIESHVKAVHPELDLPHLRAKSLAVLMFKGYSKEEIARVESILLKRFAGEYTCDQLEKELDKPFKSGGAGLWKQKAQKIADAIEEIIKEEYGLSKMYKKIHESPYAPLMDEIDDIKRWLLDGHAVSLNAYQTDAINEAIEERVRGIIVPDHFKKVLNLPKAEGGVGLNIHMSMRISDRLDMLMAMDQLPTGSIDA